MREVVPVAQLAKDNWLAECGSVEVEVPHCRCLCRKVQDNDLLLHELSARPGICAAACLYGMFISAVLTLLSLPALKGAGILFTYDLAGVLCAVNWLLLALYGSCFGVAGKLLGGGKVITAVNAFFYVASLIVVMKLLELPVLDARIAATVAGCDAGDFAEATTAAISQKELATRGNWLVLLSYLIFFLYAIRMERRLYGFGLLKGILSATLGIIFLCIAVILVQMPAIASIVCGYSQ